MLVDLTITRGRVRKFVRVRELAATHTLETTRRVRMLETQAAWKREGGSDRTMTRADMHEDTLRRMHVGFDPEPFCIGLYKARRPPTPRESTLDVKIEMKTLLLIEQPPPQYNLQPRARLSLVVRPDMKEEIPQEPGQGSGGEGKVVTKSGCPAQWASFSSQAEMEVNPEITDTTVQVNTRQVFARLPMSRQQRGVVARVPNQTSSLTRACDGKAFILQRGICPFSCIRSLSCQV